MLADAAGVVWVLALVELEDDAAAAADAPVAAAAGTAPAADDPAGAVAVADPPSGSLEITRLRFCPNERVLGRSCSAISAALGLLAAVAP